MFLYFVWSLDIQTLLFVKFSEGQSDQMREVLLNNRCLCCNFMFLAMRQVMGTINQEKPQVGVLFRALKLIELKPSNPSASLCFLV